MKQVVLLLPTYNEKDNIKGLITAIIGVFTPLTEYKLHILVIDDYSPDGTGNIVSGLVAILDNSQ